MNYPQRGARAAPAHGLRITTLRSEKENLFVFNDATGLGLGLGSYFASHAPSHTPPLLATLLSHNIPFPRVH
jgi:hypothetical protein